MDYDDGNLEGNQEYTDQVIHQLRQEENFDDPELAAAIAASLEQMKLDEKNDQNKENIDQEEEQKVPHDDAKQKEYLLDIMSGGEDSSKKEVLNNSKHLVIDSNVEE